MYAWFTDKLLDSSITREQRRQEYGLCVFQYLYIY